ncbi:MULTISPECIES: dienelactone hydrolase family protein [unclassified Pseudodesulfovibrio]|uniref:dienelactone hydrolase family protein n=1 Tax=unclassified Pseudodesulfovibrio TaxID=2661612 RepID=UPI000FEBC06F|nr:MULTISPECIES: dienelactone hydrolase family protein [unclassified Pseudodesulfovibrio]MCJ2165626.1 dienelactone hydrolase family protein [Pseudodesulfovibrio sp. S3-i]RWU03033.1 dienelactone hydrolase [Pseudodesulfovibrio sp. S3]
MEIILATEIWGRTAHVDSLAETLRPLAYRVNVIDPYDGRDPHFSNENEAYAAYLDQCGHAEYARRVTARLNRAEYPVFLVGFSAGAGAVWAAACQKPSPAIRACCFYGSAIRDMADLTPHAPVDLIFPNREPHFDVTELIRTLETKPLVLCHQAEAGHGFMNPLSAHHDKTVCRFWTNWLTEKIAILDHGLGK